MKTDYFIKEKDNIVLDPLTNVLSRKSFYGYFEYLIKINKPFTFFFLDFDDFKSINDVLGHNAGDEALIITAKRICSVIESHGGVVGRFGGDEFMAIIEDLTVYEDVWRIASEVSSLIRKDNDIKNIEKALPAGRFTLTQGIARFPLDGKTLDEIFDVTDRALYRGKQKGKNCFIIYNHELHKNIFKDREMRNLDTKSIIDFIFANLNDNSKTLDENLKHVSQFIGSYYNVSIISKNSAGKFEILYSNGQINNAKYVDEKLYLDLKSSEIDSMIYMYITRLSDVHKELKKLFEEQSIHASLLIPCETKQKKYGYFRVDSKHERIWTKEEKIVFQIIASLYALILEIKNEKF